LPDYYLVLRKAVADLNPNSVEGRSALYDRVRGMLEDRFGTDRASQARFESEILALDEAVQRIETEIANHRRVGPAFAPRSRGNSPGSIEYGRNALQAENTTALETSRPRSRAALISLFCFLLSLVVMLASYHFITKPAPSIPSAESERPTRGPAIARNTDVDDELEPGIDGGSTDAGLPYYLRRQPVYYRTVYSEGMIIIDRPQRFLYLVQPKIMALRYGIGIGVECSGSTGLRRVSQKLEWPEWVPSPELLKRRAYPPRLAGGPGNPLGARSLALDGNVLGIHGTNSPKTIGHAVQIGCFRMINDDVIDLYQRVATGESVVVMN
jgi:lipoprotein-anchoring transpeptidase ErfK/SrfK